MRHERQGGAFEVFTDRVTVLDGGLATELARAGHDLSGHLWSARLLADAPDTIRAVHASFAAAGAQVLTTASYQASLDGFEAAGHSPERARQLIRTSVTLAREAATDAGHGVRVAGSCGPYGAALADGSEYRGGYGLTVDQLAEFHLPRAQLLAEAGADLLGFETLPSRVEAVAVTRVLDQLGGIDAWVSFTSPDGIHTPEGDRLADAAAEIVGSPRVLAVGVNCLAPGNVTPALTEFQRAAELPLVAYPNLGDTWDPAARRWVPPRRRDPASLVPDWHDQGATLIGGCCGTTPADIATIAAAVTGLSGS